MQRDRAVHAYTVSPLTAIIKRCVPLSGNTDSVGVLGRASRVLACYISNDGLEVRW
jgi:hypothetical protein